MVEIKNVSKYYGKYLALDNLNFTVKSGEIVGFLGPNGAGKTTTMRIITGFMPPTYGDVMIDGMDVFENAPEVKSITGYLPEHPPVYPELTVSENLYFVAGLKRVPKEKQKSAVDRAIELTDLKERRNTLAAYLSKGLRQRLGFAQAIVNSPKVLIMDEPTVGLDPKQVQDIRTLIKRLAKEENRTVIRSTHILAEVNEICEKAIIINNGKIVKVDTIESIRGAGIQEVKIIARVARVNDNVINWLKGIAEINELSVHDNVITIRATSDKREDIAKTIVDSGAGLLELSRESDSLEDAFIKLTH